MSHVCIEQLLTFGVEEEYLVVDIDDRRAVPRAADVLERAVKRLGERVQHELYATQIELNTAVCRTAAELRADILAGRRVIADEASKVGSRLVASGSAVLTRRPLPVTDDPRYLAIARRYADSGVDNDSEPSGCHIHLGSLDRGEALQLANRLRPWLPVLQATAANSPFADGRYRRSASWRHFELQRWPTVGPAPVLDEPGYERLVRGLVTADVLMDRKMIYWYARPSEHLPTLEIRVTDTSQDVDTAVLIAVLVRGLGTTLLARIRQGTPEPTADDCTVGDAHYQAARYGPAGRAPDPITHEMVSLRASLDRLVEVSLPGLEASGDVDYTRALMAGFASRGTGAQQQCADFLARRSLRDVVDGAAARTVRG